MSRREDVDNAIWSDGEFVEGLSPEAKLLYLWSFTNPRCGMAGMYRVMRSAIVLETGLPPERLDAALAELADRRFAFYDGGVMWVRSRVKHLRTRGEKIAKAIRRDIDTVGDHEYVVQFRSEYGPDHWVWEGSATVTGTSAKTHRSLSDRASDTHRGPTSGSQGRAGQGRASNDEGEESPDAREPRGSSAVDAVFEAWLDAKTTFHGRRSTAVLDPKRRRIIRNAIKLMKQGGSDDPVADCVDAVRGWRHSPHHTGQNDSRTVYNDLGLLLRDAAHIENFRDIERAAAQSAGDDEEMRRFRERQRRLREQREQDLDDEAGAA